MYVYAALWLRLNRYLVLNRYLGHTNGMHIFAKGVHLKNLLRKAAWGLFLA